MKTEDELLDEIKVLQQEEKDICRTISRLEDEIDSEQEALEEVRDCIKANEELLKVMRCELTEGQMIALKDRRTVPLLEG